jgi:putative IMPACT (imprinted ancient) family translation regulator
LGYSKHVESWDQAQSFIKEVKNEHPKARHWCYAIRTGWNPVHERCSDDGEPTGTAGVPILGEATHKACMILNKKWRTWVCKTSYSQQ